MWEIFKSASKVWLLLVIFIASLTFWLVVAYNLTDKIVVTAVMTMFWALVWSISTYYYTRQQNQITSLANQVQNGQGNI